MELKYQFFRPGEHGSRREQFISCCRQLKEWVDQGEISPERIILVNVFANIRSDSLYQRTDSEFRSILNSWFPGLEMMNLLAQPPDNGDQVAVGIHCLPPVTYPFSIQKKKIDGIPYTLVLAEDGRKFLMVPRIQQDFPENFVFSASEKVFLEMEKILRSEGMNFSHVFRQWNYIEEIIRQIQTVSGNRQHYQVFNDVRARYYDKYEFRNGYPAATGIGTYAGGISISFYAMTGKDVVVLPVENPMQASAYEYSDQVLVGKETFKGNPKSTPRFVRAKYVMTPLGSQIFISGSAAVRGEETTGAMGAAQAEIIVENLKQLLSKENLENSGVKNTVGVPDIKYLRIYLKNTGIKDEVNKVCSEAFPGIQSLFVYSDICRDELLVEIEGAAVFSK